MYPISVMWFEGRFQILCSDAGHSVWEMIATNSSIFLCPAERCHKNCPPESLDNDELGVICLPLMRANLFIGNWATANSSPAMATGLSPI